MSQGDAAMPSGIIRPPSQAEFDLAVEAEVDRRQNMRRASDQKAAVENAEQKLPAWYQAMSSGHRSFMQLGFVGLFAVLYLLSQWDARNQRAAENQRFTEMLQRIVANAEAADKRASDLAIKAAEDRSQIWVELRTQREATLAIQGDLRQAIVVFTKAAESLQASSKAVQQAAEAVPKH